MVYAVLCLRYYYAWNYFYVSADERLIDCPRAIRYLSVVCSNLLIYHVYICEVAIIVYVIKY